MFPCGLGKTRIAASHASREAADWSPSPPPTPFLFYYSVDFRIGTRYMGVDIVDSFKREGDAQPVP